MVAVISILSVATVGEAPSSFFGFVWEIINSFVSCYFEKLGVSGMTGHDFGLACSNGIWKLALVEIFALLANGLNYCHSHCGTHVNVE
jgi:hypothetical protein